MTEELKSILAANERYSDFTLLDTPVPFAVWAKDKNYPTVQVHDTTLYKFDYGTDIIGFVGIFEWKDNVLTPLDGDTYNELMPVIGYEEDEDTLDILVEGGKW